MVDEASFTSSSKNCRALADVKGNDVSDAIGMYLQLSLLSKLIFLLGIQVHRTDKRKYSQIVESP